MPKAKNREKPEVQGKRFIEAARELGCDESPDAFEAAVKKVARHKPAQPLDISPEPFTNGDANKAK